MALDPYAFCPCGSGKKLKFCCRDLATEFEHMERMIEGEQYRACLEHAEKLEKKYSDRVGLMVIKGRLHLYMKDHDEAKRLFDAVLEKEPQNTTALAHRSTLNLLLRKVPEAIIDIQLALDAGRDPMPGDVFDSLEMLSKILTTAKMPLAARAHLQLTLASDPEDSEVGAFLESIDRSPEVPLMLKDDPNLMPCPEGFVDEEHFEEALWMARVGRWLAAEKWFTRLAEMAADVPAVWFNLALIRGWLAQDSGALEALRNYSVLDDVPLEDAVEAEAIAQMMEPVAEEEQVPAVRIVYTTGDSQKVLELLLSHKQVWKSPIEATRESAEGEPPPMGVFRLLDRPQLQSAENLSLDSVPHVLGQVSLYGKQTDREARAEVTGIGDQSFEAAKSQFEEIAGSALGEASEQEVLHPFAAMRGNLDPRWQLPEGTTHEQARELVAEYGIDAHLNRWPQTAKHLLENKTPTEAAGDARLRIRVLAQILMSEVSMSEQSGKFDFNTLRENLGLPALGPIDPATVDLMALPVCRWHRLEIDKLDDDDIISLLGAAVRVRAARALRLLALEVIDRPSLDKKIEKAYLYGELSRLEANPVRAMEYLDQGREMAELAGHSSATWDLQELSLRNEMGQPYEVKRLLDHISAEHINEPGVRQAIVRFLTEIGVLGPDGKMLQQPTQAEPAEVGVASETSDESSKIWTPDSEQGSKEKPALWTPGMD